MRALCECLEVSSDNFYLPHYLTPVEWYTPGAVVLVYVALAVAPPPQGAASDGIEDAPEPEEPYDWVSYERGMAVCPDEEEREVLTEVRRKLAKAHRAGLYKPVEGCGLFGEAVKKAK
ncbi:hypothetical protein, conserved [Angomonas deanei]|uniref:Uncharacterized protein n=1 Tax=Angomonas deanei TaxID=59799 RepID=A0A7G2CBK2_9TRYP|nr:hypothetical protein, conserved [Angomonas deanei]